MVITDVKKQKNNSSRYNIFIDSVFCFSASKEDLIKYSLIEDSEVGDEELKNIIKKCEEASAYDYALVLLGIRDYSLRDMRSKLKQRYYSEQTISSVLSKLQSYEFINDERYAKKYVDYSLNIKKIGKIKIMHDLHNKGVKLANIDSIEIDEEKQFENAYNQALKKMSSIKNTLKPAEKVIRYLLYKGYEFNLIKKVIERLFKNEENDCI